MTKKVKITAADFGLPENENDRPETDGYYLPIFEIASNPTINLSEVRVRRFNIIDHAPQFARQEIQDEEDRAIFEALDRATIGYSMGATIANPIRRIFSIDSLENLAPIYRTDLEYRREYENDWHSIDCIDYFDGYGRR